MTVDEFNVVKVISKLVDVITLVRSIVYVNRSQVSKYVLKI